MSGRIQRAFEADGNPIACLAAAADARVVVAGAGNSLYVYDQGSAREPRLIDVGNAVVRLAVTPDGRQAVALTAQGVSLFDLDELTELAKYERETAVGTGFWDRPCLALSPTGDTVFFGRRLVRWYPATGEIHEVVASLEAESMDAPAVLAITPDGKHTLVSPSVDDTRDVGLTSDQSRAIATWSPGQGPEGPVMMGPGSFISAAAITADAKIAVVAYYDHSVRVWELEGAASQHISAHDNAVSSITIEGGQARTLDRGNISLFWSLSTGLPLDLSEARFAEPSPESFVPPPEPADVPSEMFDSDASLYGSNRWAISADGRRAVRYVASTGKLSEEPDPADTPDPEGLSIPFDVWDLGTERRPAELRHEAESELTGLNQVVVSPDGRTAVAASWGSLRVFDLESGRQRFRLTGHTGPVWQVELIGEGRLAASASEDATVRLWSIETGLCIATFTGESPMRVCDATVLPGHTSPTCIAGEDSGRVHILRLHLAAR